MHKAKRGTSDLTDDLFFKNTEIQFKGLRHF